MIAWRRQHCVELAVRCWCSLDRWQLGTCSSIKLWNGGRVRIRTVAWRWSCRPRYCSYSFTRLSQLVFFPVGASFLSVVLFSLISRTIWQFPSFLCFLFASLASCFDVYRIRDEKNNSVFIILRHRFYENALVKLSCLCHCHCHCHVYKRNLSESVLLNKKISPEATCLHKTFFRELQNWKLIS